MDFALFAHVVEAGNITRCAKRLGLERTTVSRRISGLESYLGVRLLRRETKRISLTDAGRRCYDHCADILRSAQSARSLATVAQARRREQPVILAAPICLVKKFLAPKLEKFRRTSPHIEVTLKLLDAMPAKSVEGCDLILAMGSPPLVRSRIASLAKFPQIICASPSYLQTAGTPTTVEHLGSCACIVEEDSSGGPAPLERIEWELEDRGKKTQVSLRVEYRVPSLIQVRQAAGAGLGLARLPAFMCEDEITAGTLLPVLPQLRPPPIELYLMARNSNFERRNPGLLRLYLELAFQGIAGDVDVAAAGRLEKNVDSTVVAAATG
jgi:DNA-binding transcriptional LysR family regulator